MSLPADKISSIINFNKIYLDENGRIYGYKTVETSKFDPWARDFKIDRTLTKVEKAYPEDHGFSKTQTEEIFISKTLSSENSLENQTVFFKMTLKYEIPAEARYRFYYLSKVRSGRIFLTNFESGSCQECGVNSEFVTRGKARRLKNNTLLSKTAPIFTLTAEGTLERRL